MLTYRLLHRRYLTSLGLACVVGLTTGCSFSTDIDTAVASEVDGKPNTSETKTNEKRSTQLTVTPVLQVEKGKSIWIRAAFKNTTQKTIRYFGGAGIHLDKKSPGRLELLLYRNDKLVRRVETVGPIVVGPSNVCELKAGEAADVRFRFPSPYGNLEPGRYEVRMKYDVPKDSGEVKEFGITPMSFNKSIFFIDVIEPKEQKQNDKQGESKTNEVHTTQLTVTPVLQVETGKFIWIPAVFKNTTQKTIRYFGGNGIHLDKNYPGRLELLLYHNDKRVLPVETGGRVVVVPSNVRELKADEAIDIRFRFPSPFGKLKPGRYEVRVKYNVAKESSYVKEFGITPMSFNKSILFIDVIEPKKQKQNNKQGKSK